MIADVNLSADGNPMQVKKYMYMINKNLLC